MDKSLCVLILGVGGNIGQGILKALALSDLPHRAIGACVSPLASGLYTTDSSYVSPFYNEPHFLDWLLTVCKKEQVDVILTGVEPVLSFLAEHAAKIKQSTQTVCIVSDIQALTIAQDKLKTSQWLEAHGFQYPKYALSCDLASVEQLYQRCGFPLIAKPRYGRGGSGIIKIEDEKSLRFATHQSDYLLQEYIGTPCDEYTVGTFSNKKGELCGTIVMKRELLSGTTHRAVLGEFPEVKKEAEKIVTALKPFGPCNLQFRVSDEGVPYCFEINMRFSGTTPFRARFGFNEVKASLEHFILDKENIELPIVTQGIGLRYWNEIYIDPIAFQKMHSSKELSDPKSFKIQVEDYGIN